MNCLEFQNWLHAGLDGEPARELDPVALSHLAGCAACRELEAAAQQLAKALASNAVPEPPPLFRERVVQRVLAERRRRARWQWYTIGAAAGILVAFVAWGLAELAIREHRRFIAVHPEPTPAPVAMPEAPPSIKDQFDEASLATLDRTREAMGHAARHASILLPPAESLPTPTLATEVEASPMPVLEMGRSFSDGLEPVTTSARRAWGMLIHMLPPTEESKTGS